MKTYLVVGLGFFGRELAIDLTENGGEVIAVDKDMELVEEIQDKVAYAMRMDATDLKSLRTLDIRHIDVGTVCIGENFEANLLTAMHLKELGIKKVYGRASSHTHVKILEAVGVDILSPELDAAKQWAFRLRHWDMLDVAFLDEDVTAAKILAPEKFNGKSLRELDLRNQYGVNLLAIHRFLESGEKVIRNPGGDAVVKSGDLLGVIGSQEDLQKLCPPE